MLWRRVNRGLSAGRVQSPSIRLIVERERERIAFVSAGYWDIELTTATAPSFTADARRRRRHPGRHGQGLRRRRAARAATSSSSTSTRPRSLADGLGGADFTVRSVEEKPYRSRPQAPFMTSTLQQEGGRKLRLSSSQVMRVAQGLYERGYITYMRTDNVVLVRRGAARRCGPRSPASTAQQFLSPQPRQYDSQDQERPGGPRGDPPDDAAALARPVAGRAEQPGAVAVPDDLAAHAGLADGRRHRHHRHRAPRRHGRRRHRRRVRRLRHDDHVPRLPPGVRRVPRRGRRRRRRARGAAAAAHRRRRRRRRRARARRATPRRRRPATPRRRSSSASRSWASAGRRRGRRSSRPCRTAATCGRRARRSCRRGPRSPSSA